MQNAKDMAEKWGSTLFDSDSRFDVLAEHARQNVVRAFLASMTDDNSPRTGEEMQAVFTGLLMGLVGIMGTHVRPENHGQMRAGMVKMIPWAVDMMRALQDLPPLGPAAGCDG